MTTCSQTAVLIAKGPRGPQGPAATQPADGVNAFTTVTAAFVMPAELATVDVTVAGTSWAAIGMTVYVSNCGYMNINQILSATSLRLTNMEDSGLGLYNENVAPTTNVAATNTITPAGIQGPTGTLTGAAGGDLSGTYPNPTLGVLTTKGDLLGYSSAHTRQAVGADTQLLHANSATATGLTWGDLDLTGASTSLAGQLGIADGGTGQSTATAAFNALSPLTTNGDLIYYSGGAHVRLAAGPNGYLLTMVAGLPAWAAPSSAQSILEVEASAGAAPWTVSAMSDSTKMGKVFVASGAGTVNVPNATTFGLKFLFVQNGAGSAQVITIAATDAGGNTVYNNSGPTLVARGVIMLINNGSNWVQALNVT